MTPLAYVALIRQDGPEDFLVTFPDVPEAITQGSSLEEAIANAGDALDVALEGYLEAGRAWPEPNYPAGQLQDGCVQAPEVPVTPAVAARLLLVQAMQDQGLTKVDVAARMQRDEKVVRRILKGQGASLEQTLAALRAVGVRAGLAA